tara:strand:+ start:2573 stop:5002 length:2430 start_codon:yes stop_codon:yes gene_type:complete
MQIRNKIKLIILFLFSLLFFSEKIIADEFDIKAKEIFIDKENQIVVGEGSVEAQDNEGKFIYANKITYEKTKEFLTAEGEVTIKDNEGNILKTEKATYDKLNKKIITYNKTKLILKEGYELNVKEILYLTDKKKLRSEEKSTFSDIDGNIVETSMFEYDIQNNLFSSVGKIKIVDINKNKYFFEEIYIDTKKKEMIGSDVSVVLDQQNFGLSKENDPRFVANDVYVTKNKIALSKGVFTVCQKRDEKCPPWSIKAKKITHDKIKKNIYYDHATLKVYDIPIFYFPKFFHPDPSVKRQSGFLMPALTNNTTTGAGFTLPYYWVIGKDKDLTFSPKFYPDENLLFINEYRQAFQNGSLILDTSYTQGYKKISSKKTPGSRSHFFGELDLNLSKDEPHESKLSLKVQRTSNNTFFRQHNINTTLVKAENTNLENEIKYNFSKNNMYLNITSSVFQNLREKNTSDQYEYVLPNIVYGKTFFTEKFGTLNFTSNASHTKYETSKEKSFITNDLIWNASDKISRLGFVSNFKGMLRNTNYETKKTGEYKDNQSVSELQGVASYKSSLPMKKEGINYSNIFSPNFMFRYAPGHMKNISGNDATLDYTNLYALNKTSEIEKGLSAVLGFDFKINEKKGLDNEREKLSLSLGQVFNHKENKDIPSSSSLDQKMSDVVGKINYNFSNIGKIDYKFLLDHNFNDLNYNEISTELNFGMMQFNLDYLEERRHVGVEHYASSGITLNFNDKNKLTFSTKRNFKTESTELYNLGYQYSIDCLTAGLVYRREFYRDSDLEPTNNLMFTISFIPFGSVNTPAVNQ